MAFTGTGNNSNYVTGSLPGWPLTSQFSDWPLNGSLTLFGWVRMRATGSTDQLFSITNGPSASVRVVINTTSGGVVQSQVATTLTPSTATGTALTLGEWTPLMATLHESGGQMYTTLFQGAATYSVNRASAAANFTNVGIGVRRTTSVLSASTNVDLAEVAVWYGHLGAAEFEMLSRGACPADVASPRLQRYYPLRGDLLDLGPMREGATQTGAYDIAWTDHPPVDLPRRMPLSQIVGAAGIDGAGAATLGTLTGAAAGTLAIAGTAAGTLGAVTGSGVATLAVAAAGAATLGSITSAAAGALAITGTGAATLVEATASGVGDLAIAGTAAATLGDLAATGAGVLAITGAGAVTLGGLTAAGTDAAPVPAPASRTYTWPAHSRAVTWPAESRVAAWPAQSRTVVWRG